MATLNIEALLEKRPADESVRGLLRVGQVVDAWKVVAFVGAGRSAEVYRVINTRIGGEAALKLLVDEAFGLKARFVLETDVLRSVAVAGLPRFFGSGVVGGRSYYVMESPHPLIIPLATKAILPFMTALAKTVGELHEAGYVHRDLKPANILLRKDGSPVLIDLGLAKRISGAPQSSPADELSVVNGHRVGVGTPDFAAPEQLIRGDSTVRSDVFSLGKVLKACCGKSVGHGLRTVIRKATSADPEDRYGSAAEFVRAMRRSERGTWTNPVLWIFPIVLLVVGLSVGSVLQARRSYQAGLQEGRRTSVPAAPVLASETSEEELLARQPGETESVHFERLLKGAKQGSSAYQCAVAEAYFHGRGTATNLVRAVFWYELAARQECPGAEATMGLCKLRGIGCAPNAEEAFDWLGRAANHGNLGAMNDLAFCYMNGHGVERNPEEAFAWAMRAAERGHAGAQTMVGECYLDGYGVEQNRRRADDWLQRAARQGNERAMMLLRTR